MHGAPGLTPPLAVAAGPSAGESRPPLVRRRIHALRPGTFPASPHDLTLTASDIAGIAAAYNPDRYHAPVVIGHPEDDHPAWGWIVAAEAIDGDLWLTVELLPEMDQWISERRYGPVSVSLWSPSYLGNPTPGVYALRHLGFLGAAPPAVKGLSSILYDAAHAGGAVDVVVSFKEPSMSQTPPAPAPTIDLSEREATLKAREATLVARERELRRTGFKTEFGAHVAAARITPVDVPALVELADRLTDAPVVSLSDGERPAIDVLREFLAGLPPRVDLSERAPGGAAAPAVTLPQVPTGFRLSESGVALHSAAVAYQQSHPGVDYVAAVRAVQSQR
jgi:hypothetical protein